MSNLYRVVGRRELNMWPSCSATIALYHHAVSIVKYWNFESTFYMCACICVSVFVCGCGDDTDSPTVKNCEESREARVCSQMIPTVTPDHHKFPNSLIPVSNGAVHSCDGNSLIAD